MLYLFLFQFLALVGVQMMTPVLSWRQDTLLRRTADNTSSNDSHVNNDIGSEGPWISVPDCYDIDVTLTQPSTIPTSETCTVSANYRYYNGTSDETYVFIDVEANTCQGSCSISVNDTQCSGCTYNSNNDTITMPQCLPGSDVFPAQNQTIPFLPQNTNDTDTGNIEGQYLKLSSCQPPDPWEVAMVSAGPPPAPVRNREGMCHIATEMPGVTTWYSNQCTVWKSYSHFYNRAYESAAKASYASAVRSGSYACGFREPECQVNVTFPVIRGPYNNTTTVETETMQCASCIPDGGRIAELNCSNLPDHVNLTLNPERFGTRLLLADAPEMCQHPAAVADLEYYAYCGEERVLEPNQCYAVKKERCSFRETNRYDGCTFLRREYQYYNYTVIQSDNLTMFDDIMEDENLDEIGHVEVSLKYSCTEQADNRCQVRINGMDCNACQNEQENVTMIDCTNLEPSAMADTVQIRLDDQAFSVFYEAPEVTLVSPDGNDVNCDEVSSAISQEEISLTRGWLHPSKKKPAVAKVSDINYEEDQEDRAPTGLDEHIVVVPSKLRFFFRENQGLKFGPVDADTVLERVSQQLITSTVDYLHTKFLEDSVFRPHFHSVRLENASIEYHHATSQGQVDGTSGDELTVSFDALVVLEDSLSSPGAIRNGGDDGNLGEKEAAIFMAGSNWNRYLNSYVKTNVLPHARKVIYRASLRSQ